MLWCEMGFRQRSQDIEGFFSIGTSCTKLVQNEDFTEDFILDIHATL